MLTLVTALSIWGTYPFAPQWTEVVVLLVLPIRWPSPASLVLPHPVGRVKAAGSGTSIKMLLLSSALKRSRGLQSDQ